MTSPSAVLRNQGQILGEERRGDRLLIEGRQDGRRVLATSVRVDETAEAGPGQIVGELKRRTENILQVETGEGVVTVEVPETAVVETQRVAGVNDVSQLRHHLEVERMSKSKGNTVNPDELVANYGADTVRTYLMFAFDWEKGGPWDSKGILGSFRFIQDVWKLGTAPYEIDPSGGAEAAAASSRVLRRQVHQTIEKVDHDMAAFKWNTAIAALMKLRNNLNEFLNTREVEEGAWVEAVEALILLLAPVAPHVAEELWRGRGHSDSVHVQSWPQWDPELLVDETVTMVVQVNGKVRDRVEGRDGYQ